MWRVLFGAASIETEWDGDEALLLFFSAVVTICGLGHTWNCWQARSRLRPPRHRLWPVFLTDIAALAFFFYVSWNWSSKESRHGQSYTWLIMIMGSAWLSVCRGLFSWLGISLRDDVCERGNKSATMAVCGAILGAACIFGAANTGEGPSFWNNIFTAMVGGLAWFVGWIVLETLTHISRAITEDRDPASGLRLGGYLLAMGLILARALAGNWHSTDDTVHDLLRDGWPAGLILVVAVGAEKILRPSAHNPAPSVWSRGLPVALFSPLFAAVSVVRLGWWEGVPR